MVTESKMYKNYIKPAFEKAGWLIDRIENSVKVGNPDIQAVRTYLKRIYSPDIKASNSNIGLTYYIEAKIGKSCGRFVTVDYRPGQYAKLMRLYKAGAPVRVAVWWENEVLYLLPELQWPKEEIKSLNMPLIFPD